MFMIYVVRNPAECIASEFKHQIWIHQVIAGSRAQAIEEIVDNSRVFINWPQRKLLLYYEDLIANATDAVVKLADFLGVDTKIARQATQKSTLDKIVNTAKSTLERSGVSGKDPRFYTKRDSLSKIALPADVAQIFLRYPQDTCLME
jgi:hypothetical protein